MLLANTIGQLSLANTIGQLSLANTIGQLSLANTIGQLSQMRCGGTMKGLFTKPTVNGCPNLPNCFTETTMLIFDAHLDLSMNAIEWNRDLTQPIEEIRRCEEHLSDKKDRGLGTVCLPEMRRGRVGICVATQIARSAPGKSLLPQLPGFSSPEIAWSMTQGQLAWYRAMEASGQMQPITNLQQLQSHVDLWLNDPPDDAPIGFVLSLEGADSIRSPQHLQAAYDDGLRALGPAHYGPGRYAIGTHSTGGLPPGGRELLAEMQRLGIILDVTHLCDESFWEALSHFDGPVWASHNNCRKLVDDGRQFSDQQINHLIERGAVIGGVLDAWMMVPGWKRNETTPEQAGVRLEHLVDHIDHICQIAGNAKHCGIGSDLDGGFGREQSPLDLETIADLQKLRDLFDRRGFSQADIQGMMYENWVNFLRNAWG